MTNDPGILALWNDCAEEGMADYERWYMAQHLPERVGATDFGSVVATYVWKVIAGTSVL